ncbi:DoxX family protein [Candidatus Giovannonibacteria bacterium RIFCSPHIGHO2_02_43_13]|uniref:DoxX family protein n=1 Tax=Candidatus Giovannonibacteria bacterium RIFCSPHIGHO2_02_43_13 TaxID=1798330 RepID=A0A1F5WVD8_9BACT|nr:MAG: DoxX family protein [Parcubacteria group bacterium GW2011_GWA2_44_13]OGF73167.1 MAG: DoxX family protein [Candidatus Giovannonibacteria bacterium RIFCSPHIGHO2_12_FULL_44_42]OGF79251.1 MAG: DoxX family protein [Candidatus Giovannonibacteria bacterium RIFCSPHIGHO2_02_43_13]OGF88711.1 MAG: DoxX family protein [Candidatus Giovannonibacteria bacterium RIFCSPLOWO2_02_FULL_43_54]OGF96969.1 MAG: DoxX family protein [Candidatus Giovannonibacteria bacterium RIFCSPLOWO2_12_FULL_44_32]
MGNIIEIPEPKLSRFLFADTRVAWLWLVVRFYVGYVWITAGYAKFTNPAWVGDSAGTAIKGFFTGAIAKATGQYPQVSSWYASFLTDFAMPNAVLFSYVITYGEILVGLGLIVGLFTGIAAFFGSFMNLNFLLAGTVGQSPVLLLLQLFLILAWRNAGWLGLDRYALPKLGVPWQKGSMFK